MRTIFKRTIKMSLLFISLLTASAMLFITGCSTGDLADPVTPEEYFERALYHFNEEEYLDAQKFFDIVKLQFPASNYADDAQFYMGEVNFAKGEFVLAAFNFSTLRRLYPHSEYYQESLYKTALSFYELSPSYDRDQEYTMKAIRTFSEYQTLYPGDSLYNQSGDFIKELRSKLAEGEYSKAELYRKLRSPHSSIVYYDIVIDDYSDTDFCEQAYLGKTEAYIEMKKYREALDNIDSYRRAYRSGEFLGAMETLEESARSLMSGDKPKE